MSTTACASISTVHLEYAEPTGHAFTFEMACKARGFDWKIPREGGFVAGRKSTIARAGEEKGLS